VVSFSTAKLKEQLEVAEVPKVIRQLTESTESMVEKQAKTLMSIFDKG